MPMTIDAVKALNPGDTIYHDHFTNADGSAQVYKVNGMVKTWKRDPDRVRVPLKRGLFEYGYLTEDNIHWFSK